MVRTPHDQPLRLGVLAPLIAGAYMTRVMAGAVRVAAAAGARVIAIQTLDPGTWGTEITAPPREPGGGANAVPAEPVNAEAAVPRYALRTAWDRVAGFLVMLSAVEPAHLRALRDAGMPVVLVSEDAEGFTGPVVRADNRVGVTEAVSHLVQHGHRRIAFAGSLRQADIRDRLDAYRDALAAHGIEPDPGLLFPATDNLEAGGEIAARRMLAAGLPSTAVIAATDYNALGIMSVLTEAGLSLPHDQAIVGFDDVEAAAAVRPTLSTVHQGPEAIGATAARLLLELVRGEAVADGGHLVPTRFVVRESCGCTPEASVDMVPDPDPGAPSAPRELLRHRLERLLISGEPATAVQGAALDRAAELLARSAGTADASPDHGTRDLPEAAALLCEVSPRWTTVATAIACLRRYGDEISRPAGGDHDRVEFERMVSRFTMELSRAMAQQEATTRTALQVAMDQEHDVDSSLIRGSTGDPRLLGWLWYTPVRAACLGLWPVDGAGARMDRASLEIAGTYAREGEPPRMPARCRVEAFPPVELVDAGAGSDGGEIVVVLPTMTTSSDLGLLAMITRVEATAVAGRDRLFDKGALLGIAIERELMNERLRRVSADLTTFSQAMAHELRNPVATISMWAAVARSRAGVGEECEPLLRIVDEIRRVAGYAGDLVGDLLRYTEVDAAAAPRVPVDLNLAAGRALATLDPLITRHRAVVETRPLPTVTGTFSDLELVLRTLIENAIRHGGAARPRVRVDAALDGGHWTVRCRDNGRGIAPELRETIFEPFARGAAVAPGSGLGLATCRRIVRGLGGRIWVEASRRSGATFAFTLPAAPEGTAGPAREPR